MARACICLVSLLCVLAASGCDDDGGAPAAQAEAGPDAALVADGASPDACPGCPDGRVIRAADFGAPGERDAAPAPTLRPVDDGCSDLYSQDVLPRFYVEIEDAEWAAIQDEFAHPREREAAGLPLKPYHPVRAFRYEDEVLEDTMIRLKGNPHFSWRPPKMQFVISFREYDRSRRFHGLRKLNLDAPWYDRTLIRERVALSFLREAGMPASCANNALVFVNGEFYGLYVNKEHVDKEFLERNFDDPEGNLYKYGFELKTNEAEADVARKDALWATQTIQEFEAFVDRAQVVLEWAAEAMLPHFDGYWCCNHNYYVYDHPGRGFLFVPHDMDITFDSVPLGHSRPQHPLVHPPRAARHFGLAMAEPSWREDFVLAVEAMLHAYDPGELERRVDFYARQTADAFDADPNLPFEREERRAARQSLRDYFAPRRAYLDEFVNKALACQRGEPGGDLDGDGVDACEDCDDLNRQVRPGAHDTCNERDDDCDGRVDEAETCADCEEQVIAGIRYALCPAPQAWVDGPAACARQGGRYAVPVDLETLAALATAVAPLDDGPWWVGANDGGAEDRWVDRQALVVDPPWAEGQPNGHRGQNCATIDPGRDGLWADESCLRPLPIVCELPPAP